MAEPVRKKREKDTENRDKVVNAPTIVPKEGLAGRWAVLSVLARAAEEPDFMTRLGKDPDTALNEYYTLTQQEKEALANGDIKKIESWVGKLDKRLSTWLLYRLSQER
jgi:hypothetical protein